MATEQECAKLQAAAKMIVEVVVSSQIHREDEGTRVKQFKVVKGGSKPISIKSEVLKAIEKLKLSRELSKESSDTLNELLGYMDAGEDIAEIKRSRCQAIDSEKRSNK